VSKFSLASVLHWEFQIE